MNNPPRKSELNVQNELNIHISGQLFGRETLQSFTEVLVPMLLKQLLADPTIQRVLQGANRPRFQSSEHMRRGTGEMLTISEVADRLGIQPVTVRSWISARKIPMVKVGRCVRVRAEAVQSFIDSNTIPAR